MSWDKNHMDCVYFKYYNETDPTGHCLLNDKEIAVWSEDACKNIVYTPSEVLSKYILNKLLEYDLRTDDYGVTIDVVDEAVEDFLEKSGFNDYPKGEKK